MVNEYLCCACEHGEGHPCYCEVSVRLAPPNPCACEKVSDWQLLRELTQPNGACDGKKMPTNSAMDAIMLIKDVAERMNQSTDDGCTITLCACHGLGARIVELAEQHQ